MRRWEQLTGNRYWTCSGSGTAWECRPRPASPWLRSLERASRRTPQPDFVWTGPEVVGLHARDTRRVYEELLSSAKLFPLVQFLRVFRWAAVRSRRWPAAWIRPRDFESRCCSNINRGPGDTSSPDSLVRRFAERFWTEEWPGKACPSVYYDPRSVETGGPGAVLHAKAVVADEESVFITSANLTEAAMGPEHRTGTPGAGSDVGRDDVDALSNLDRKKPAAAVTVIVTPGCREEFCHRRVAFSAISSPVPDAGTSVVAQAGSPHELVKASPDVVIPSLRCPHVGNDLESGSIEAAATSPIASTFRRERVVDIRVGPRRCGQCPDWDGTGRAHESHATCDRCSRAVSFRAQRHRTSPRRISCRCL